MSPLRRVLFVALIMPLAACAAATPGYSPDGPSTLPPALQPFKGGAMNRVGRYEVSAAERALSCPKLTGSMQIIISRLKNGGDRQQPGALTTTLQSAAKPFVGQGANLDPDVEVREARARLAAYNDLLAEKKCKTVDIGGV